MILRKNYLRVGNRESKSRCYMSAICEDTLSIQSKGRSFFSPRYLYGH